MNVRFLAVCRRPSLVRQRQLGAPAGQALESRIDAVTVYPRGADVTRVARIALTPGANVVTLDGLPGNVDPGRLTALADDERVEVRFIRLDVQEQREAFDAEVGRLEASIREVRDAIEAIDDEIAAAELQLKFLEGLAREYAGSERGEAAAGRRDIASWQQAMDTIGTGAGAAMEKMREARKAAPRGGEGAVAAGNGNSRNKRGRRAASTRLAVHWPHRRNWETDLRVTLLPSAGRAGVPPMPAYLDTDESSLRLHARGAGRPNHRRKLAGRETCPVHRKSRWRNAGARQDSRFLDLFDPRPSRTLAREAYDGMPEPRWC